MCFSSPRPIRAWTAPKLASRAGLRPRSRSGDTSGTLTLRIHSSNGRCSQRSRAYRVTRRAVSQCWGAPEVMDTAIPGIPWDAPVSTAPTVPECRVALPVFAPRFTPERIMSGRWPKAP